MQMLASREVVANYDLPIAREPLSALANEPGLLIPPRLRELVDCPERIVATAYPFYIGSLLSDNGYDVDLAVLISEINNTQYEGPDISQNFSWSQIQQDPEI